MARPTEFDRTEVLDRATRLFWERGFGGTSISDLEAAMGIGRTSIYAAFGAKEDLLPTFNRLKEKHASATMMWFQNGKLWPSRLDAQEAMRTRGEMGRRGDAIREIGEMTVSYCAGKLSADSLEMFVAAWSEEEGS